MSRLRKREIFLAGDIGGTKTHLGLFERGRHRPRMTAFASFPSRTPGGLETMAAKFLERHGGAISGACFGVAGPVVGGRSKITNLSWSVSEKALALRFEWPRVRLVNDLTATAMAIPVLAHREFSMLNRARARRGGPVALIAPGTGLGQAFMIYHRDRYVPVPSEGGHADFAPSSPEGVEFWQYLRERFGHVSLERVLSGPGLVNIYCWLRDSGRFKEPAWLARGMLDSDPAGVVVEAALHRRTPVCRAALRMFSTLLAAAAGNLALIGMATGGVFLGGGIPLRILPFLREDAFMAAFVEKGRFASFLEKIPVRVIENDRAALLGAACGALEAF